MPWRLAQTCTIWWQSTNDTGSGDRKGRWGGLTTLLDSGKLARHDHEPCRRHVSGSQMLYRSGQTRRSRGRHKASGASISHGPGRHRAHSARHIDRADSCGRSGHSRLLYPCRTRHPTPTRRRYPIQTRMQLARYSGCAHVLLDCSPGTGCPVYPWARQWLKLLGPTNRSTSIHLADLITGARAIMMQAERGCSEPQKASYSIESFSICMLPQCYQIHA